MSRTMMRDSLASRSSQRMCVISSCRRVEKIANGMTFCIGGERWFFSCPAIAADGRLCNRRALRLYLPPGGREFACRVCHHLIYPSSRG